MKKEKPEATSLRGTNSNDSRSLEKTAELLVEKLTAEKKLEDQNMTMSGSLI